MKAKNWKKFVPKDKSKKDIPEFSGLTNPDGGGNKNSGSGELLENAINENSTLKKLFEQREELEKKMGQFTGGSSVDDGRMVYGEIPSISAKQKEHQQWQAQRAKYIEQARQQRQNVGAFRTGLSDLGEPVPELRSNVTPSELGQEAGTDSFIGKIGKKKDDFNEDLDKRRERLNSRKNQVKKAKDQVKSSLDNLDDQLKQFEDAGGEFEGSDRFSSEVGKLKETLSDDAKLNKKLEKMTDSFVKKRGGEKLDQRWEQLKKKKQELDRHRKKKNPYEERKKRLLNVDRETLEEFDERRRKRREERLKAKKEEQKAEERREEQKKMLQEKLLDKLLGDEEEDNSQKKSKQNEERKEEERREEERQLQKEQRLAQQKAEKQREEKKEKRRAERRKAKKEEEKREKRRNKSRFD